MREADSLMEELKSVTDELLALNVRNVAVPDLNGLTKAIERRCKLMTRVGQILRESESLAGSGEGLPGDSTPKGFRAALDQALEAGESAVQRILSLPAVTH